MPAWEITVIALGGALLIVSIYLIITLKKVNKLIGKLDLLIADNSNGITSIVSNVDSITSDTKKTVGDVSGAISGAAAGIASKENKTKESVLDDNSVYQGVKAVVTFVGFAYTAYKFLHEKSQNKKINKIYKQMKRSK